MTNFIKKHGNDDSEKGQGSCCAVETKGEVASQKKDIDLCCGSTTNESTPSCCTAEAKVNNSSCCG
ncbi:MAG: hypothetical protein K0R47_2757 [Brevibacillus sp.]|jgi:hypothetical protein|nr:hypothetical protein [Brevibacillus sp.]